MRPDFAKISSSQSKPQPKPTQPSRTQPTQLEVKKTLHVDIISGLFDGRTFICRFRHIKNGLFMDVLSYDDFVTCSANPNGRRAGPSSLYPYLHTASIFGRCLTELGTRPLASRPGSTKRPNHLYKSEPAHLSPGSLAISAAMAEGLAHQSFARLAYVFV